MKLFLDFETEVADLEAKISELRHLGDGNGINILNEITNLEFKAKNILKWEPKVKLNDGLLKTINHYQHLHNFI